MPRPMLDERMTVRMPGKLLAVILDRAARTNCSANHVVLSSLEHDFARMDTYSLDYYNVDTIHYAIIYGGMNYE